MDTILEIKYPTLKKLEAQDGSLLKMTESKKYDVKHINGTYVLKETASALLLPIGYYYQVQIAMHCANKTNCKLPNEHIIVDVPYNQVWTMEKICHLKAYF